MNVGAATFYEFYVGLKNRPGWTQFLAQKLNVMIVTIPGNFKYAGWDAPISDVRRQHKAGDASLEELFLKLTGGAQVRELAEVLGR